MDAREVAEAGEHRKHIAESAFNAARRAGRVRREEQDRVADHIELLLYEAKGQEAIDMLVRLARDLLDPVKTRP
jgi:hypothetical protein